MHVKRSFINMGKIKKLPLHEAQKIAAGEVVERPANVVKELIENAIDADAHTIAVYVQQGGHNLIRVIDDGHGMSPEDAEACFAHHTTSKITRVEDLNTINSFGFRGEALASISAVAKVTLITKQADIQQGIKLQRMHGKTQTIEEVSCTNGTDINVEDLFFNVPARKKFLKTPQTEWRHIVLLFQAFCFDYPSIHFKLYSDNKCIHNCPSVQSSIDRVVQMWENNTAQVMIPLSEQITDNIRITGFISNHQFYRYDRSHLFFFVNNRWIRNQNISRALLKGYLNVVPPGRYPTAVINISIDPTQIDVNIHPRKQEVQFLHPRIVENLIHKAVKQALEQKLSEQIKKPVTLALPDRPDFFEKENHAFGPMPPIISAQKILPVHASSVEHPLRNKITIPTQHQQPINKEHTTPTAKEQQKRVDNLQHRIIGYLSKTYILLEQPDGLFFIDQHAAHERILYERFKKRFGNIETVTLLFAQIISLSESEFQTIYPHLEIIRKHGIQIEEFGKYQLIIHATPVHLKDISLIELMKEIIGLIVEFQHFEKDEFFKLCNEKIHAQMACKAAVKAGDTLTEEQMNQLIADLYTTDNRFACPHGRPTGWLLSAYEIEKKFKRKL